jgi:hypothetical protein
MSIITVNANGRSEVISLKDIEKQPNAQQTKMFNQMDNLFADINKKKYLNAKDIVNNIRYTKSPYILNTDDITLLALMDFFQKKYVVNTFHVEIGKKISQQEKLKREWRSIDIISKLNNFPHLIGISGIRDKSGEIISRAKPKEFLDGVLYQWILLTYHAGYALDKEKLEVFSWMHQTLLNPTYILLSSAIKTEKTKFRADLIFIRKILFSQKYAFHIIGLKNEKNSNFAFKSQFAVTKNRHYRIEKMFDLKKAIFDYYKEKMLR